MLTDDIHPCIFRDMRNRSQSAHTFEAANKIANPLKMYGMFDDKGNTYFQFTKDQTAQNAHMELSEALNAAGIGHRVGIQIGRGKYTKGIRYARITC